MSWAFVLGMFVGLIILIVGILIGAVIVGLLESNSKTVNEIHYG